VLIAVIASEELTEAAGTPEKIFQTEGFQKLIQNSKPIIWVITKAKAAEKSALQKIELFKNNQPVFVDSASGKNSEAKSAIFSAIKSRIPDDFYSASLTENYCNPGDNVLLVMPQDSQAPKDRLILPQVQTIRDLLDRKVCVHCCTQNTFLQTIDSLKNPPDLIITDSQIFPFVYDNKPAGSKLTSFSILMAAYKGDIELFVQGAKALKKLTDSSRVLIAEACTHAPAGEDIGTVKIPAMLKKIAPKIQIDFVRGTDFPETPADLQKYDLIIHCGACMFNKAYVLQRQKNAKAAAVPMTNYGVAIAELNGILDCLYR
ncbi:MAG: [FeFe] hydrogenase H-cluster maturation GTPase HydF, partial [Spirochaetaceae bacterium]|nr:[FeFe] hydrogenase H-cluster maturation GTPase HydF [Spirochaetaceae bacterium]